MLPENKELLQQEKTSLAALLNTDRFPRVLLHLANHDVISDNMRKDILCQWPQHEQIFLLLDILETSGDDSFDVFHESLLNNGYQTAAAILKPNPVDFSDVAGEVDQDGVFTPRLVGYGYREITRYEGSYRARALARVRAEQQAKDEHEKLFRDGEYFTGEERGWGGMGGWRLARRLRAEYELDKSLDDVDGVENQISDWPQEDRCELDYYKYLQVNSALSQQTIHKYQLSKDGKSTKVYKMSAPVKGCLLFINNNTFPGNEDGRTCRPETEVDVAAITELFCQLNFDVNFRENLTGQEMSNELQKYSEADHTQYDCFVCIISTYSDGSGLIGIDGAKAEYYDILDKFTSTNCPSLADKPKLFLIHAPAIIEDGAIKDDHIFDSERDFFVNISMVPDNPTSKFYKFSGSLFLFLWAYIIEQFSNRCHFGELADKVANLVDIVTKRNNSTRPLVVSTLKKHFYLFPGLYQGQTPR